MDTRDIRNVEQDVSDSWDESDNQPFPEFSSSSKNVDEDVRLDANVRLLANSDARPPSPEDPEHKGNEVSANNALSMTRWHPFLLLFVHYARRRGDHCETTRSAMDYFAELHPWFYKMCLFCDFLVTVLLVGMVLLMLFIFIWKALEPFPWEVVAVPKC
jgi:hypothetical protein